MKWSWWKKYILNIDTIVCVFIAILVLYFIFTSKRKKYRFEIPDADGNTSTSGSFRSKKKSKAKKRSGRKLNKHEEECRRIFQDLFGCRFKSVRPKWLKNPVTRKNLELDGYNPDITTPKGRGLAFEYDGQQHSKYTPHFHPGGVDEFEYQVVKDSWKDQKCKEKGVMLIRIPHFVAFQDLERYIKMMLKREGVEPSPHGLYASSHSPDEVYRNFSSKKSNMYG